MRRVTATLAGLLIASPLLAQEPVTQEREHVVRDGDTLWDLAGYYFSNPFRWRVIYNANTMIVEDPHWIYPDEVLIIPGIRGDTEPDPRVAIATPPPAPLRTVFYRPPPPPPQTSRPTVLEEPGITTFPVRPGEFTSAPYLMDPDRLEVRARFMRPVGRDDPSVIASVHPRDRVYLSYVEGVRPEIGERLLVVDITRRIDGAGRSDRMIHPKAVVRIVERARDVMEAEVVQQFGPIYPDRQPLVPVAMFPDFRVEAAEPVAAGSDLEGRILEFVNEQPLQGRTALAFVNLGQRHGVSEGDIFQAYTPARAVRERRTGEFRARIEELPPEVVAHLRVIRVTDEFATVKVDDVEMARLEGGMRVRRVRSMP